MFPKSYCKYSVSEHLGRGLPEGADVRGSRTGGVSGRASSAGQLMDGAERLGELCLLFSGYTSLQE